MSCLYFQAAGLLKPFEFLGAGGNRSFLSDAFVADDDDDDDDDAFFGFVDSALLDLLCFVESCLTTAASEPTTDSWWKENLPYSEERIFNLSFKMA